MKPVKEIQNRNKSESNNEDTVELRRKVRNKYNKLKGEMEANGEADARMMFGWYKRDVKERR